MNNGKPMSRFSATLRIGNAGRLHLEITRTTDLKPTKTHSKGELRNPRSTFLKRWQNDVWLLKSPLPKENDLSAHLDWLWGMVSPHKEYFKKLVREGVEVDIFCGYRSDSLTGCVSLRPEALRIAYELNVSFGVSVIVSRSGKVERMLHRC